MKLIIYRFLRVVFGVNCSPFTLNGTLRQHFEKYSVDEREIIKRLIKDFYVDDLISGYEDYESGKVFYDKVKEILRVTGFD